MWLRCASDRILNTLFIACTASSQFFLFLGFMDMLTEMTADKRHAEVTRHTERWNGISDILVCNESLIYLFHFLEMFLVKTYLQAERHTGYGFSLHFVMQTCGTDRMEVWELRFVAISVRQRNLKYGLHTFLKYYYAFQFWVYLIWYKFRSFSPRVRFGSACFMILYASWPWCA